MDLALKSVLGVLGGFAAVMIADRLAGKLADTWVFSKIGPWKR
jgi:hypothetical protein